MLHDSVGGYYRGEGVTCGCRQGGPQWVGRLILQEHRVSSALEEQCH